MVYCLKVLYVSCCDGGGKHECKVNSWFNQLVPTPHMKLWCILLFMFLYVVDVVVGWTVFTYTLVFIIPYTVMYLFAWLTACIIQTGRSPRKFIGFYFILDTQLLFSPWIWRLFKWVFILSRDEYVCSTVCSFTMHKHRLGILLDTVRYLCVRFTEC